MLLEVLLKTGYNPLIRAITFSFVGIGFLFNAIASLIGTTGQFLKNLKPMQIVMFLLSVALVFFSAGQVFALISLHLLS